MPGDCYDCIHERSPCALHRDPGPAPDPETTRLRRMLAVLTEVGQERERQHARWGQQDLPDGTSARFEGDAKLWKARVDLETRGGTLAWTEVLLEEVFEAAAETNPQRLRRELLQVAAVAAQWVECIDRRRVTHG